MKLLVLRFSSIGDIVLVSPVLRCLKQQVKGAEVHVATKTVFADLVRYSPYVDKVHELHDDLGDLGRRLKTEGFDEVIDLHHNLRTARIKRALGVPSHSFPKLNIEKWLLVNFKMDRMPRVHIIDRYLGAVAHLGVKNDGQGLDLFIPPERQVSLSSIPETHRAGYTILAIGGAHATKRLPDRRLIQLAGLVEGPIVIVGGDDDKLVAGAIVSAIGGRVFDATGKHDILGSASLIAQAKSVIAHDSGAMHIAAAFAKTSAGSLASRGSGRDEDPAGTIGTAGSPPSSGDPTGVRTVVSIWGNTVPAFGMGPYIPQHPERAHIAEVMGLDCRPCSKIGFDQCPKGHFHCMEKQDLRWIAEKARPSTPLRAGS